MPEGDKLRDKEWGIRTGGTEGHKRGTQRMAVGGWEAGNEVVKQKHVKPGREKRKWVELEEIEWKRECRKDADGKKEERKEGGM